MDEKGNEKADNKAQRGGTLKTGPMSTHINERRGSHRASLPRRCSWTQDPRESSSIALDGQQRGCRVVLRPRARMPTQLTSAVSGQQAQPL